MKAIERKHIEAVGEAKFNRALAAAMMLIRQDTRLIGLDKARGAIADEAAFRATGFQARPLILPKGIGEPQQSFQDICDQVLERAVEAARSHLEKTA